jgi:hypothetical protein
MILVNAYAKMEDLCTRGFYDTSNQQLSFSCKDVYYDDW